MPGHSSGSEELPAAGTAPDDASAPAGARPSESPGLDARSEPPAEKSQPEAPVENMLPRRAGRRFSIERLMVRVIATCGIVGIGVGLAAILASSKVQGWIIGLVVALVSVILSAVLWSSREM